MGFCPVCIFRIVPGEPQDRFPDDISGSLTPAGGLVPFDLAQFTQNPQSANFNSVPTGGSAVCQNRVRGSGLPSFFSREEVPMSQFRLVVLSAVAFVAAGFGSVAMAGCGGDNGCSGGRSGLFARLQSKKAACSGAVAKDCSGGGLLSKMGGRRGAKCSGTVAPQCAPAPVCNTGCDTGCGSVAVDSGCTGCAGTTVMSDSSVIVGSAPCTNCGTAVNAGTVESSTIAPPVPVAPAAAPAAARAPAAAVPTAPEVPAVPSASDVPKA